MSKLAVIVPAVIVPALLTAACASHRSEQASVTAEADPAAALVAGPAVVAAASDTATSQVPEPEATDANTVEISELDTGLVCEPRRRTGSRISRNICYTPEEQAALQAAKREQAQRYIDDLRRDQEMRAMQQREQEEQQRRAMMGAMGGGSL